MKSSVLYYFEGSRLALSLAIIMMLEVVISPLVSCGETIKSEEELFQKYRPLAIDESLTVDKDPVAREKFILDKSVPISSYYGGGSTPAKSTLEPIVDADVPNVRTINRDEQLVNVDDYTNQRLEDTLFALPQKETSKLTSLIAPHKSGPPTFMSKNIIEPSTITQRFKKGEKDVIAHYRIMIPILVPAIKRMSGRLRHSKEPVKFVKEEVTEMVPVKTVVSHKKEIVKAEKVPQRVITDYVQTNGNQVPTSVTDRAMLGEKVIKSVVENID